MLLEAKSREQKSEFEDVRKRLQFGTGEKRSSLPAWLALALGSMFAYVKTLGGEPEPHHSAPSARPFSRPSADHAAMPSTLSIDGTSAKLLKAALPHEAPASQHGSTLSGRPFHLSAEPALKFPSVIHRALPTLHERLPTSVVSLPGNDNSVSNAPSVWPVSAAPANFSPAVVAMPTAPSTPNTAKPLPPATADGTPASKVNRTPVVNGSIRLNDVFAGQAMLLGLGDLLLGARDPDGDALHVTNVHASTGIIEAARDGWAYQAAAGAQTLVSLTYQVDDGEDSVEQTATFNILSDLHLLTGGDDVYVGTVHGDEISGLSGDDNIDGQDGDDVISGGDGNDHILGGDGNDMLSGDAGDDVIFGGLGNDTIRGGDGNDRLFGEAGNDLITGDAGNDYLSGGDGNDLLQGGSGDDILDGGDGNDVLDGGNGDNVVLGGWGDDIVIDTGGDDTLDGQDGYDTLDLSSATGTLLVDLQHGTVAGEGVGHDLVSNFEAVVGGSGDDRFVFGAGSGHAAGGEGNDTFVANVTEGGVASTNVQITDFHVGDRIEVEAYEIRDRSDPLAPQDVAEIYATDQNDSNNAPIRATDERYDDLDVTIVQAHLNASGTYDINISLQGHHDLVLAHLVA